MILKEVKNLMVLESELRHYGVKGMKWGIRRDTKRSFTKAAKKLEKLDQKAVKAENKKLKRSDPFIRTSISDALYSDAVRKSDKARRKAEKWFSKMEKKFGTESVKSIKTSSGYDLGKKYMKEKYGF